MDRRKNCNLQQKSSLWNAMQKSARYVITCVYGSFDCVRVNTTVESPSPKDKRQYLTVTIGATGTDFWVPRHPGILHLKSPTPGDPRGESPGIYVSGKVEEFRELHSSGNFFHFLFSHLQNNMILYIFNFSMQQSYKHISSSVEASLPSFNSAFAESF